MKLRTISDTSALVLLLDNPPVYGSDYTSAYRNMLDLSAGFELMRQCYEIWPHLDQIIKNRKKCILDETLRSLGPDTKQVVLLGSGIDALSLELLSCMPDIRIYEVDLYMMDVKRDLVRVAAPDVADQIRFTEADLCNPEEVIRRISLEGWRSEEPSVLVLEGISYYLMPDALWSLLSMLGKDAANHVILEYILPDEAIGPTRSHIPTRIFDAILQSLSSPMEIYRFGYDTVVANLKRIGGSIMHHHTMKQMEFARVGYNHHFPNDNSGWVEVVCIRTRPGIRP